MRERVSDNEEYLILLSYDEFSSCCSFFLMKSLIFCCGMSLFFIFMYLLFLAVTVKHQFGIVFINSSTCVSTCSVIIDNYIHSIVTNFSIFLPGDKLDE